MSKSLKIPRTKTPANGRVLPPSNPEEHVKRPPKHGDSILTTPNHKPIERPNRELDGSGCHLI